MVTKALHRNINRHQALWSPEHLTETSSDTKDTRGTAGTTVTRAPNRNIHRHHGHQRHYGHQRTSQKHHQTSRTPEALQALWSPGHLIETSSDTKDTRGTAGHQSTSQKHHQTPRTPEALQALWSPEHIIRHQGHQRHWSPEHLAGTYTYTMDTRGTAGTMVTRVPHTNINRHQGHQRHCRPYGHQSTSQKHRQTPRPPEALQALWSSKYLIETPRTPICNVIC